MSDIELRTQGCGGYAVVVLRGELDITDAESTVGVVAAVAADGQRLIIDLEALDYIDCHITGALLKVRETARRSGGDVLLAAPHGPVLRLLTLIEVPGVHPSVAAAGTARAGRRASSGIRSRVAVGGPGVAGPRVGGWPRPARWLRGLRGPRE
jgi:anti-sigma B factor antagonist